MGFLHWFGQYWFVLLQSAGIVGGLFFTAVSLRIDTRVRRVGNLISITHEHRDIWTTLYRRPELWRVLDRNVDLGKSPPTDEEELFVKLLILHLVSVHEAIKNGVFIELSGLRQDVQHFFGLPIPRLVWERMKPLQNKEFVGFVEECWKPQGA